MTAICDHFSFRCLPFTRELGDDEHVPFSFIVESSVACPSCCKFFSATSADGAPGSGTGF